MILYGKQALTKQGGMQERLFAQAFAGLQKWLVKFYSSPIHANFIFN